MVSDSKPTTTLQYQGKAASAKNVAIWTGERCRLSLSRLRIGMSSASGRDMLVAKVPTPIIQAKRLMRSLLAPASGRGVLSAPWSMQSPSSRLGEEAVANSGPATQRQRVISSGIVPQANERHVAAFRLSPQVCAVFLAGKTASTRL